MYAIRSYYELLYDEPLYLGMNANWKGLFHNSDLVSGMLEKIVLNNFGQSENARPASSLRRLRTARW